MAHLPALAGLDTCSEREQVKVVQELLRHSNCSITQDLYQQADADAKRSAQGHVGGLFVIKKAS
jgi:integrase